MSRPYTGYDKTADGKRPGFEMLVDLLEAHFGLWNNGTLNIRPKRGKNSMSVHATGRAGDLSWRGAPYRGSGNYQDALRMMEWLEEHADGLGIEAIFDYYPKPYGRGWKCDRHAWNNYSKKAFSGVPGGDWVHIEVSNEWADDPQHYIDYFEAHIGSAPEVTKTEAKTTEAPAGKDPWFQVGSKGAGVKRVQRIVGAKPDGDYGRQTEAAVKKWQAEHDLHVDGIWGPGSDAHAKALAAKAEAPAPAPAPAPEPALSYPGAALRVGLKNSEHVKAVQEKVGAKPIDGWFGNKTKQAVEKYQRENGLYVDGVVGPVTWKHLFSTK